MKIRTIESQRILKIYQEILSIKRLAWPNYYETDWKKEMSVPEINMGIS